MSGPQVIISCIVLIILGVSISANNFVHSIIVKYLLYNDVLSSQLTRLMGFSLVVSSLFLLMEFYHISILIIVLVILIFIFLMVRGRGKIDKRNQRKKQELINMHLAEVEARKQKIEQLKNRIQERKTDNAYMSIADKKKSKWNDGRPTNKDIIEQLNK